MKENTKDDRGFARVAGVAAIFSGVFWISWGVINVVTNGGSNFGPRATKAFDLLTPVWNLLLIPAAIAFHRWLRERNPGSISLFSLCGILSLTFWAYRGATHQITSTLETTYLWMATAWWVGIGLNIAREKRWFGLFTVVLGAIRALDGTFSVFEPMPRAIYLLAAPRLPMAAIWSFWSGVTLLRKPTAESFLPRSASN